MPNLSLPSTRVRLAAGLLAGVAGVGLLSGTDAPAPASREVPVVAAGAADIQPVPDVTARAETQASIADRAEIAATKRSRTATPPPPPAPPEPAVSNGSLWDRLAQCESSGNWASTVGLYEGGLQFHPSTWDAAKPAGYPEAAYQASRAQQIAVAEVVLAQQGWGAWPACASKLGLR